MIETPTLHFIGNLDPWIPESQTLQLAGRCRSAKVAYFMGTHFVPRTKEMINVLAQFVAEACGGKAEACGGKAGGSMESLESDWVNI